MNATQADYVWADEAGEPDASPSVEELDRMVKRGLICAECSTRFTKAHHRPTVCAFCGRRIVEAAGYHVATHREVTQEAHAALARARKQRQHTHGDDTQ